jgi:Tfp pilus assembly protein PilV
MRARLRRLDQSGSALILALIVLAVLSVGAAAILTLADTSIRATLAVRAQGSNSYSADGAVQAAINNIRSARDANGNLIGVNGSYTTPTGGNNCPTLSLTVDLVASQVTCQPMDTSGQVTLVDNPNNDPHYAVLMLSTSPTGISESSNNVVTVGGPVLTNANIDLSNSVTWNVAGTVSAHGCTGPGTINATGGLNCTAAGTVADPGIGSATYDPLVTAITTPAATKCLGGATTFYPGTYSSPAALVPAAGTCNSGTKTAIFTPGVYYFNYTGVWGSQFDAIIGGVPTGAAPGTDCDASQPGVQWVFGGSASFAAAKNKIYLCAPALTPGRQQISVYGLTSRAVSPFTPEVAGTTLFDISGNSNVLVVRGTVYAPLANFNIKLAGGAAGTIVNRGIVANSLSLNFTGGAGSGGTIQVPPSVPTPVSANRTVMLAVSNGGQTRAKAVVQFDDTTSPAIPGKQVTVQSWSVYR